MCKWSYHVEFAMVTNLPSESASTGVRGFLITILGNVRCVLVLFPFFFDLTVCVELSGIVATGPVSVARCLRVRGAMLVWQDDDQRVCWEERSGKIK
jgi:hypothetical protein